MKTEFIDITLPVKPGMLRWPGDALVRVRKIKEMNKGAGNNLSSISLGSHAGTHMDAPLHFFANGKSLDKMPIEAVIGPARVVEIKDEECVKVSELARFNFRKGERILIKTRNSCFIKERSFRKNFVYISLPAAKYIVSRGVMTVGVDYLSVGGFKKDGPEVHRTLLGAGIWIIEGLDLTKVRSGKYNLFCLPLKTTGLEGAPARVVVRKQKGL